MISFSIVIPMYNLEKYIKSTLESIVNSPLDNRCELILVDDGSKDGTASIAEEYLHQYASCPYKIIKKSNSGVSDTRNMGIEAASGKYLIFCDGDDFFETGLIQNVVKAVTDEPDMVIWRYRITQREAEHISQEGFREFVCSGAELLRKHLLEGYRIRLGSFAVKKALVDQKELRFTSGCNYAEDMEFIMKCIAQSERVRCIPAILFTYAKRDGSLMYSYNIKRFEAPRAMKRAQEYVQSVKNCMLDKETEEYMRNGLFLLHCIYSFDACVQSGKGTAGKIYTEYLEKYADVEGDIKRAFADMRRLPRGISRKRLILFKWSRKWYLTFYGIRNR